MHHPILFNSSVLSVLINQVYHVFYLNGGVDFEKQTPTNVVVKASNGKFRVILKLQNGLGILKRFKNLN